MEVALDTTFHHAYECEQLSELPARLLERQYYYPGASTEGGRDGIMVEVRPEDGEAWVGTFAFGRIAPNGPSGIFSMPDSSLLCVVAKGDGYIVCAKEPTSWERIGVTPIIDVRPVRSHGIVVFAEFTRLVAYGSAGVKWKTRRLSWDNLRITDVTEAELRGEFWDIQSDTLEKFTVDLATGLAHGGVDEP